MTISWIFIGGVLIFFFNFGFCGVWFLMLDTIFWGIWSEVKVPFSQTLLKLNVTACRSGI